MSTEISPEIKQIVDEAAGKEHSLQGPVMRCLEAVLAQHAHELAEKQRGYLLPEEDSPHVPYNRTVRHLADLIDPQVGKRCVNDTDGDGNCAACARNPEAPCRRVFHGELVVTAVRLAASFGWRTISVRRLLRLMDGDRRYLPKKSETGR